MKKLFVLIIIFSNSIFSFSQNLDGGAYSQQGLFVYGITGSKPIPNMRTQGSQYYDETFKLSFIKYFNKRLAEDGYMRYNAFTDEIELADTPYAESSDTSLLKDKDLVPVISGETFIYIPHRLKDGRAVIGYLIEIFNGNKYKLYEKRNKVFMEEKKARTSLENTFPPRYVSKIDYYISASGQTPILIPSRKKDFLSLFAENQSLINYFIRNNKIKINKLESILEVIKYAESINN
jgi:hypothetical protein